MVVSGAVPGLAGIEHVGLTVPDIEEATAFFRDVLGAEPVFDVGPFEAADDWLADHLDVHPRARIRLLRMLRLPDGPSLELFEYDRMVGQVRSTPRNSDIGGWHVAFYVADIDKAVAALKAHGARVLAGPVTMDQGPSQGLKWVYFTAPWGQTLEVVSCPKGLQVDRETGRPMWRPHVPGD
jgi:catechol 2,3-dioxygenase-like lactoylglutathione lyase family enzyme